MATAFITGIAGLVLTAEESAFLRAAEPWGFILFKRNVDTPAQVRDLVTALRETVGRSDAPVLIDQEGGRVQRLGPPHWPKYPPPPAHPPPPASHQTLPLKAPHILARLIAPD